MNRRDFVIGTAATMTAASVFGQLKSEHFTGLIGRPPEPQRCFRSPVIEQAISEMRAASGSPELAAIFANCFPNTLDTTVFVDIKQGHPHTYVITGDINAMWLRDSAAQVWPYLPFANRDPALRDLLEGTIRRHSEFILLDSYANAFNRYPDQPPLPWTLHDKTEMRPGVAGRKWEVDSLCYPVRLAYGFWKITGSTAPFDHSWLEAAKRIVATFREQQRLSGKGPYHFQRSSYSPTNSLPLGGYGNPVKPNGLICSGFRPSDDACIYPFVIPANLFAAITLDRIAAISLSIYSDATFSQACSDFAREVRAAVKKYGTIRHQNYGEIVAYEVDGYGNTVSMDDANAPSLLSLAYLELVPAHDPLYRRTRAFALSFDNPYFFRGTAGEGIGGPHVGLDQIWPMSIIIRAITSDSNAEISSCLQALCTTTAGTNMMHESFDKNNPRKYTRPWFAWANSLFGELLLKLKAERPELLRDFRVSS